LVDLQRGEAIHLAAVFKLFRQIEQRPFAERPQFLAERARARRPEPGDQGAEDAEFAGVRSDPGGLSPLRLAGGQLAEIVAAFPVPILSGEPHGLDGAEPDGARALQARLQRGREHEVRRVRVRQPGQHVHLRVGQRRAEGLPGRAVLIGYPVACRVDDLSLSGGSAGTHGDVAGPQRLPRLTKSLTPRLVEIRPQPCRRDRRLGRQRIHVISLAYL
jgi:hypothetical protein